MLPPLGIRILSTRGLRKIDHHTWQALPQPSRTESEMSLGDMPHNVAKHMQPVVSRPAAATFLVVLTNTSYEDAWHWNSEAEHTYTELLAEALGTGPSWFFSN